MVGIPPYRTHASEKQKGRTNLLRPIERVWLVDEDDQTILAMLRHVEFMLAEQDQRMLVTDTSGLPEFEGTRRFYLKHGYDLAAEIPEYPTKKPGTTHDMVKLSRGAPRAS